MTLTVEIVIAIGDEVLLSSEHSVVGSFVVQILQSTVNKSGGYYFILHSFVGSRAIKVNRIQEQEAVHMSSGRFCHGWCGRHLQKFRSSRMLNGMIVP